MNSEETLMNLETNRETTDGLRRIGIALHDLCQPLTTIQCRLELAGMVGTTQDYREAIALGLRECARLAQSVETMREVLRTMAPEEETV